MVDQVNSYMFILCKEDKVGFNVYHFLGEELCSMNRFLVLAWIAMQEIPVQN